ncbi:hypothetical protein RUM43_000817 [Polyplax serrata]|uniref:Uncharacterized protein n=1 Tax=Polyplax serrata TaxID=468196 RepID=A0AAN8SD16_POLSC
MGVKHLGGNYDLAKHGIHKKLATLKRGAVRIHLSSKIQPLGRNTRSNDGEINQLEPFNLSRTRCGFLLFHYPLSRPKDRRAGTRWVY